MSITFELPPDIERSLTAELGDLGVATKEAALVELYRQGQLSQADLCRALGTDRLSVEAILKRHNVVEDTPTDEEYGAALARLKSVQGT